MLWFCLEEHQNSSIGTLLDVPAGVLLLVPSLSLFLPFLILNELSMHWSAKANSHAALTEKLTSILGKL